MSTSADQPAKSAIPSAAYGWVIVALAFLSTALVLGSRFTLGMFLPYMPEDLGVSTAAVSGAFAVSMLGAAALQPVSGYLLDRWGGRTVLSIGLACAGIALCGTAYARELWQVVLFMGLFTSIAFASVGPVSSTAIVMPWFEKNRGAALGVATSGAKVAMVVLPPILAALIAFFGWRVAMLSLGCAIFALIPATIVLVKPAPGSTAARNAAARRAGKGAAQTPLEGLTLRAALRTPAFWLIAAALFANGLIMNLVFIHLPNYVLGQGYHESLAATGLAILGGVGIIGTMVTGAMSDRMGRRNVMLLMFGARGVTALLVVLAPGPISLAAFVIVFGILGYGAIGVIGAMASEFFDQRAIGAILGTAYLFNQIGGAAGVFSGGASVEWTGDYSAALWLSIITTLLSFLCILALPKGRQG